MRQKRGGGREKKAFRGTLQFYKRTRCYAYSRARFRPAGVGNPDRM